MTEFKTVEGHEIKVGECYQTRCGFKAFVTHINPTDDTRYSVEYAIVGKGSLFSGMKNGFQWDGEENYADLMRPWPTNKLEVTDEMVEVALKAEMNAEGTARNQIRAALEAVFAMIKERQIKMLAEANTKWIDDLFCESVAEEDTGWPLFEPIKKESVDIAQSKDDGWIEWRGGERPVKWDVLVKVKYRGALHCPGYLPAIAFRWTDYGRIDDIVAYRIIDKPEPEKEKMPETIGDILEDDIRKANFIERHGLRAYLNFRNKEKIPTFEAYCYNGSVQDFFELNANVLCKKMSEYLDKYMKVKE